jgi:hypothetical protein
MPLPGTHRNVITQLAQRLPAGSVAWAITGSACLALHGLDIAVNDIDVQTDAASWKTIQHSFAQHITRPVTYSRTATIESYFGELRIDGITVDIVGAPRQRLPDGGWTPPADPRKHRTLINVDGMKVPVLDLAWEEQSYRLLGRDEKADAIRQAIRP